MKRGQKMKQAQGKTNVNLGKTSNPKPSAEEMKWNANQSNTEEFVSSLAKKLVKGADPVFKAD
jgi:hypothetical protein